ncbi:hypothetical protein PR048_004484 [Dryococelus australis]|uniref:Uncharacterized protein n=1 Tax=Dryococelus australis TaxID=614101 RepID=A0ABQ9I6K4_9NEOP|nr:hypothetical protein PR048_004484 [Dryococelus australis]
MRAIESIPADNHPQIINKCEDFMPHVFSFDDIIPDFVGVQIAHQYIQAYGKCTYPPTAHFDSEDDMDTESHGQKRRFTETSLEDNNQCSTLPTETPYTQWMKVRNKSQSGSFHSQYTEPRPDQCSTWVVIRWLPAEYIKELIINPGTNHQFLYSHMPGQDATWRCHQDATTYYDHTGRQNTSARSTEHHKSRPHPCPCGTLLAFFCGMLEHYARCAEDHPTLWCTKDNETQPTCYNCKEKQFADNAHSASLKSCPIRLAFMDWKHRTGEGQGLCRS